MDAVRCRVGRLMAYYFCKHYINKSLQIVFLEALFLQEYMWVLLDFYIRDS